MSLKKIPSGLSSIHDGYSQKRGWKISSKRYPYILEGGVGEVSVKPASLLLINLWQEYKEQYEGTALVVKPLSLLLENFEEPTLQRKEYKEDGDSLDLTVKPELLLLEDWWKEYIHKNEPSSTLYVKPLSLLLKDLRLFYEEFSENSLELSVKPINLLLEDDYVIH